MNFKTHGYVISERPVSLPHVSFGQSDYYEVKQGGK